MIAPDEGLHTFSLIFDIDAQIILSCNRYGPTVEIDIMQPKNMASCIRSPVFRRTLNTIRW